MFVEKTHLMKRFFFLMLCAELMAPAVNGCGKDDRAAAGYTEILTASGKARGGVSGSQGDDPGDDAVKYDIYLLIGQSNMAGRGMLLASDLNESPDGVFLLGAGDVPVQATHPFNQYSSIRKELSMQQMNPGYSFAVKVHSAHPDRPILIVCNARGGTSITAWGPGSTYYSEAVRRTKAAMKYGTLKAILWHQGCADSGSRVSQYMGLLKTMVNGLRSELSAPEVPFIAGELATWRSTSPQFNIMIRTISDNIPHTSYVSSEGLGMLKDESDPHFNREGQILLGQRYADKVLEMVNF